MPADRNLLLQPFVSPSIWNTPISSTGVTYSPANLTPATGNAIRGSPIAIFMDPTQPPTDIQDNGVAKGNSCAGNGTVFTNIPMEADGVYPAGPDNWGFSGVHLDGHSYAQGAAFARCTAGGIGTAGKCLDTQDLLGDGLVGDTGASHLPIHGGVIRVGEIDPGGVINHALQMICQSRDMYKNATRSLTYRWPSTTSDGYYDTTYAGTNPLLVMGALLALKPSFNLSQLTTTPAKILATALINFGGYIANTISGGNALTVEVSGQGTGSNTDVRQRFVNAWAGSTGFPAGGLYFDQPHTATNAWTLDCIRIWANLQIVKVPSGDAAWGPGSATQYGRVLSNYGGTKVGSGWDGSTGTGAPLTTFPDDLGSSGGGGGIARVGATLQSPNPVTAASATQTVVPTLTAGHGMILCIACHDTVSATTVTGVSDTGGNAWTHIVAAAANTSKLTTDVWVCRNVITGGSQTITVTMSTATGGTVITCVDVSGQDMTSFWDQVIVTTGNSTAPDSGPTPGATSQAGEFAVGFIAYRGGTSSPTGPTWGSAITSTTTETLNVVTLAGQQLASYVVDGIQTAAAVQEFSATIATNIWTATVLTFLAASTNGPPPGAPTDLVVRATGTTGQIAVSLALPAVVGDGITSTVLTYYTFSGGVWSSAGTSTITGTGTTKTVTGLVDGTQYMWSAHSVTDGGAGPETALPPLGPVGVSTTSPTAPSAPIAPVIDATGPSDAVCDWGPQPPIQGTALITSYTLTITVINTGATVATFTVNDTGGPGSTPSLLFDATGLPTGLLGAAVTATNSVGTSASSPVTPFTIVGSPSDNTHLYRIAAYPTSTAIAALAPTVKIGFQANPSFAGTFVLGSSLLGSTDTLESFVMTDVSQYVTETLTGSRGRSRETDQYSAGTLTFILRNENRDFDPTNAASPYYPGILPRAPVQISLAGQPIFTGYVSDFGMGYINPSAATASVPCIDGFGLLAMTTLNSYNAELETSDQRIEDILDRPEISYPGAANLDVGVNSLQASTQTGVVGLDFCQTAAISEGGILFVDRFGVLQFKNQVYIPEIYSIWPKGILAFSDNATDQSNGAIGYTNVSMLSEATLLFNQIQATRTGGLTQQVDYLPSEQKFLIRCLQLPTLECVDDPTVLALCNLYLLRYAFPEVRFDTIEITLDGLTPQQRASVIALDLGNGIMVTLTPPGGGSPIIQLCMIEKIDWNCDATQPTYKVTFGLMNISGQVYFILGSATQGVLAQNKIF